MIKIFYIFLATYSLSAFAECPLFKVNFKDLEELSNSLDPIISIVSTQNVAQFCQLNGLRDFKEAGGLYKDSGWGNSFIATRDSRENLFLKYFISKKNTNPSTLSVSEKQKIYKNALNSIESGSNVLSSDDKELYLKGISNILQKQKDQGNLIDIGLSKSAFLCKDLTFLNVRSCANGVTKIINIVQPVDGLTTPSLWKEAITNPIYMKVFKKVSAQIVLNLKNNNVPKTRLLDDLKTEFFVLTNNKKASEDYAWNTMALLAGRGGNANYAPNSIINTGLGTKAYEDNRTKDLASRNEFSDVLWVLSNGAMVLDRLSAEKGFLYTFPKEVNNLCDYGKNYHFWMTAYLARRLNLEDGNIVGAATAAFTVQKGYQFAKVGGGRDPSKPFHEALYSNYSNNIRLDLSLAAIGAWYGVTDGKKIFSQNEIDDGIKKTFKNSKALKQSVAVSSSDFENGQPVKTIGLFSNWKQVINPDEVFKMFETKSGY